MRIRYLIIPIIIITLYLMTSSIQGMIDREYTQKRYGNEERSIYIPSARYLRPAVLGYDELASSLYWLRVVQYIGDGYWKKRNYPHIYQMIDLVTDLSPGFDYAYQVGGVILTIYGERIDESNSLLEKGMRENPGTWQIPFYLGFNHFFYLNDYQRAARYMDIASQLPGTPSYLPLLVSRLYTQANDPDTALEFLQRVYENTEDEDIRKKLAHRIKGVIVERDILILEKGRELFYNIYGYYPDNIDALVSSNIINKIPEEPFGGNYYIDTDTHEVRSSSTKERLRIYKQ